MSPTFNLLEPTLSVICANIDNSIQVHIPRKRSSQSFVFKMKCHVTSNTTHDVLISKDISYKSYREICSGEPKKVNLGHRNDALFKVKNKTMILQPPHGTHLSGELSALTYDWEILFKFFSIHKIEPNWLDCEGTYGHYDENLGGWTGCMGKVWGTEYWIW